MIKLSKFAESVFIESLALLSSVSPYFPTFTTKKATYSPFFEPNYAGDTQETRSQQTQ